MAAKLVTIYWRDIPAQVNAQAGRTRHRVELDPRFQRAIDRAAKVAGLTTAQDYTSAWRRTTTSCSDDLAAEATAAAAALESAYDTERLRALIRSGGLAPAGAANFVLTTTENVTSGTKLGTDGTADGDADSDPDEATR